jgi:hypothetical protein
LTNYDDFSKIVENRILSVFLSLCLIFFPKYLLSKSTQEVPRHGKYFKILPCLGTSWVLFDNKYFGRKKIKHKLGKTENIRFSTILEKSSKEYYVKFDPNFSDHLRLGKKIAKTGRWTESSAHVWRSTCPFRPFFGLSHTYKYRKSCFHFSKIDRK